MTATPRPSSVPSVSVSLQSVAECAGVSPAPRTVTPTVAQAVADVVSFLISPNARYMTGQALNVSGGMVMY